VGQWFLALVADQVKELKGEPLLKQTQAARAGPGRGICGPALQLCAEDLLIALRQQLDGFFPGVVGGEQVETRLKAPWRQRLIGLLSLGPVDEGLTGLDGDGAAVDDLHGKEGAATGNVVMGDGASHQGIDGPPACSEGHHAGESTACDASEMARFGCHAKALRSSEPRWGGPNRLVWLALRLVQPLRAATKQAAAD